ncbi:MAG: AAA family ATPase [Burkholderiales bacterium]
MTHAKRTRSTTKTSPQRGRLSLRLFGRFEPAGGAAHDLEPKDALLLAHLAIEGPTPRARLASLLWPDVDDERARGNLRQRLLRLKRTTGVEIVTGGAQAQLAAGIGHDLAGTHELLEALEPELAGGIAEWLEGQRERRRRGRADALAAAADKAEADGDLPAALTHAAALVDLDTLSEDAHRRLMRLHYLRGDAAAALAAYQRCARILRAELNTEPSRATRDLMRQVEQAVSPLPVAKAASALPVTILRPPRLVGRKVELAAMAQAWDAATAFLLLGEAGMGKSRALAEFAHAHPRAVLVQARPGDAGVPYATLARLLRAAMAGRQPELADGPRTQLARVLPELQAASPRGGDGQRPQLQQAIAAVLRDAQREGVRGILLDDLHFADDASVEMLRAILGGESAVDLRWGFAQRTAEATAAAQALRETLEEAFGLTAIALAPLDAAQMAALVDSLGVPDLDGAAIAVRLVRHTGGNPMFALETLKHVLVAGGPEGQLPRPTSVGALIERRLRQLTPPAIALARVAAVAGVDFSIEMAEHVLKTPAVALADAWNELESAQVLRGAVFAHDLVFEAALRSLPAAIATHTHASIAEWLERADGEPARIAAHWEATATPQRALPSLRRAAERAFAAMRPREAIDFLGRAADLEADTASPEQAFGTLAEIVDRRHYADRGGEILPLLDRLDGLAANPEQRIVALLLRSDHSMHRKVRLDDGIAAAERAVALAAEAGFDWLRLAGSLSVAVLRAMRGEHERGARLAEDLLPEARRWPEPRQRCNLLAKIGFVLNRAGMTARALELFDESAAEAAACGYWTTQITALASAGQAQLRLGRPAEALDRLARADALRVAHDRLEGAGDTNDWMAALALRQLGRHGEALARVQAVIGASRLRSPGDVTGVIICRADAWLDLGQTARAMQDRELAQRAATEPGDRQQVTLFDLRLAAEANVRTDDAPARGRALLAEAPQVFMQLAAKLLLAALAAPAEALAIARDVAAAARQAGFRGLEASALSRAAIAEMNTGDLDGAVTHARLSVELAAGHGTEDLSWPALVGNAARVLQRAGLADEARQLAARGVAWLRDTAERHVPPEFRDSFLNRNAVNLELQRLAIRLG